MPLYLLHAQIDMVSIMQEFFVNEISTMLMPITCRKKLATGASNQVLTPQCGACAPGVAAANPKAYNASMSGLAYVLLPVAHPVTSWQVLLNSVKQAWCYAGASMGQSSPKIASLPRRRCDLRYAVCPVTRVLLLGSVLPPFKLISLLTACPLLLQLCQPGHPARECLCKYRCPDYPH